MLIAKDNEIAVVVAANCTKKEAMRMAEHVAEAVNGDVLEEARHTAFADGWSVAAVWANRGDLLSDIGSPAYISDRDAALRGDQQRINHDE